MAVKTLKAAEVQRGIREMTREIIRMIEKRRISGSTFIASGEGIPLTTAWACEVVIFQCLATLEQKHQQKYQLIQLSPLGSWPIGWCPTQVLHPVIGSSIVHVRLECLAIAQCSWSTLNKLRRWQRWRDTMESYCLHQNMEVLGWFGSCQMERRKWSSSKKWCICCHRSTLSHSLSSPTTMSQSNRWITTVSISKITVSNRFPLHLRLITYIFEIAFWNKLWNHTNTPTSATTTAAWQHFWRLGMHLGAMQRSGCHGMTAWPTLLWRRWTSCWKSMPTLRRWLGSAIGWATWSSSHIGSWRLPWPSTLLSHYS